MSSYICGVLSLTPNQESFESLGFRFDEPKRIGLPKGWKLKEYKNFFSSIFDGKNRRRAVFYAAEKNLELLPRYYIDENKTFEGIEIVVRDSVDESVIYDAGECKSPEILHIYFLEAEEYLDRHYLKWQDPLEYWD